MVKPVGESDEAIVAVHVDNHVEDVAHLQAGVRVAVTEDPDVHMMGMIMLEPGDLDASNVEIIDSDTYVLVAKHLLKNEADVGIFLAEAYDDLSNMIKKQLRILVRSQISVIHHSLMIGPRLLEQHKNISNILVNMHNDTKGKGVLESLNFQQWEVVDDEEMEFMIDLMDTLTM